MTRDEILKVEAGQDLDMLVSEKVLRHTTEQWNSRFFHHQQNYSTDNRAAWEVVGHLNDKGYSVEVISHYCSTRGDCVVTIWMAKEVEDDTGYSFEHWIARAETAPLAICRAALLALA